MNKINFYPTTFCEITLNDISLKHLQVGNIGYQYKIENLKKEELLLFLEVDRKLDKKRILSLYNGLETEYVTHNNKVYYRNCNTIVSLYDGELFYKGKLLNSFLNINWKEHNGKIKIKVHATKEYLYESRSRLTRSSTFELLLNSLIMHFAVYLGYIPFHAASVNLNDYNSIVFMGLPNTGKTTTSVLLGKKLKSQLIAEDIIFINKDTLKVYSCPFTLNPKSSERFKSDTYIGNKVSFINILTRSDEDSFSKLISNQELINYVLNMNYFEFSWLHDSIIRHMFFQGKASLNEVSEKYLLGQKSICKKVKGIELGGKSPELWIKLLGEILYT